MVAAVDFRTNSRTVRIASIANEAVAAVLRHVEARRASVALAAVPLIFAHASAPRDVVTARFDGVWGAILCNGARFAAVRVARKPCYAAAASS